jgi:RNA polymerase sigma-70 factor, ECF subfamily
METVGTRRDDIEVLFEAEFPRLVRALGVAFDPESAADAVQEAFIAADRRWRRISRYDDPVGWIRRVAINRLRNGERNRRRRREILDTVVAVPDEDLTAELLDLRAAVAALPERARLVVCLHYLAALPVAEVAALLEISDGTVKSTLHEARKRLRAELQEEHHG